MKRPSFQFYPADWRTNANLRRCSEAARGAWMDVLCVLHDSDEYGVVRWPLAELARVAGVAIRLAKELADKLVLRGADQGAVTFTHTPRHAGKDGEPVTLIEGGGPIWFSSRMVKDEWRRKASGGDTKFKPTKPDTTPRHGDDLGDGASTSSSSSSSVPIAKAIGIGVSQAKPPRERKARRGIPDGFPFEADLAASKDLWLQRGRADLCSALADEVENFRDHHLQHASSMADWPAAWRTWARKAMKYNRAPGVNNSFPVAKILKVV